MFPRISDLLNFLFGTRLDIPVQTYGFMVAMAFLAGAAVLYHELKRKELAGQIPPRQKKVLKGAPASFRELLFTALFGFILGWKGAGLILYYDAFRLNPQDFILSWQGSIPAGLLLAAGLTGFHYYKRRKERLSPPVWAEITVHPRQLTGNILLVAAVFGIIGSKIFDTLERLDDLVKDPAGTIFSFEGLSFYGGLLLAAVAVVWYARKNGILMPYLADAISPSLILAYAVGRIGCQLSGDGCWGVINPDPMPGWLGFLPDWVWSFHYPHNVIDEGVPMPGCAGSHCYRLPYPVYPTPLYETMMGLVIFGILTGLRKALKVPGYLFSVYMILNGVERFLIEGIRVNRTYRFLGAELTQAQFIAIFLVILGIAGFWYFRWMARAAKEKQHGS